MISVLVTSLDQDYFNELYPQILDTGHGWALEVVVCSPYQPQGWDSRRVWVPDQQPEGSSKAMRKAFIHSQGDYIVGLPDDVTLDPHWLRDSLEYLVFRDCSVVAIGFGTVMTCFGLPMANFPLARRATIEKHFDYFYPFTAGWGDVSFSMGVWKNGGVVLQGPDNPIHFRQRDGHPESPHKILPQYANADMQAFLTMHQDLANEWMGKHPGLWCYDTNLPRPTY